MDYGVANSVALEKARIKRAKLSKVVRSWQLYVMLILPVLYILIFAYYPMYGVQIAFRNNGGGGFFDGDWVGLKYFIKFFESYQFERIITNTITIALYSLIAGFPMPIILALALNTTRHEKFKKLVQMITYMPHFVSVVVIVGMMLQILNPRTGLVSNVLGVIGHKIPDLISLPQAFSHIYVWSGVWQSVGWGTIIYLAALASVDPEQHEAAIVDGATRFQRMWHIDWPAIIPTTTILLILSAGGIMNVGFEKVYLMQNELNRSASEVISTYVYNIGLAQGGGDFSYATAIGLFNSIVNFAILMMVNYIGKRVNNTSLW